MGHDDLVGDRADKTGQQPTASDDEEGFFLKQASGVGSADKEEKPAEQGGDADTEGKAENGVVFTDPARVEESNHETGEEGGGESKGARRPVRPQRARAGNADTRKGGDEGQRRLFGIHVSVH